MGKNRTKRFGALKPNPTGIISEKDIELEVELNGDPDQHQKDVPSAIVNIVEKLQAPGTEERACGCQLLASIVAQPKAIGYLIQLNAVKIAAPLFIDACVDVRKSALGALRNMSVYGQTEVCDIMISKDVLTPLTALIKQYGDSWVPQKGATKYDTSSDVLVEAVELLSNLCESNNTAVRWFNKEDLLTVLLPLLKVETYGYSLSNAVARCLHVVSENNSEVSKVCQQPEVLSELVNIISPNPSGIDGFLFRTLVTGILLNLSEVDLTPYYKGIVVAIVEVLDMDSFSVIEGALQCQQETEEVSYESELTWPEVDKFLNAQGVSLELLANMCCSDDDWEDLEGQGSSESSDDLAMETTCDMSDMTGDASNMLCLSSEVTSAFLEKDIFSKILKKASPLTQEQVSTLEANQRGKNTIKKLQALQCRALLCLSNIVGVLDETSLAQSTSLMSVWSDLYKLASNETPSEDFTWAVTSAMRAVIQRLAEMGAADLGNVSDEDIDFLVGLAKSIKNRETQINVVRIISTIGCIIAVNSQPHPLLKKIGTILGEVACNNEDLVVVAEALDSLFDVFKEDHTDPVVKEIGLVDKLRALQPTFKTKVSSQKKKLGENCAVVMMAKSNLAAYIKYKVSQK